MTKDEISRRVNELHVAWYDGNIPRANDLLADLLFELQVSKFMHEPLPVGSQDIWPSAGTRATIGSLNDRDGAMCGDGGGGAGDRPKTRGEEIAEKMVDVSDTWLVIDDVFVFAVPEGTSRETAVQLAPLVRKVIASAIDAAISEERERCAKIAEVWTDPTITDPRGIPFPPGCYVAHSEGLQCTATSGIATAIRNP